MHFTLLIILALVITSHAGVEGMRKWTNNKNKNIEASLVRIFETKSDGKNAVNVTFKLKKGRLVTFPVSSLSLPHQKELQIWIRSHPTGAAAPLPPYSWPSQYIGSNSPKVIYTRYDKKRKAHLYQTKHFDFYIDQNLSKATVSKCVAVFDTIVEALDTLPLQLDTIPREGRPRYEAILVSNRETYMRMGGIPNSGGFFAPSKNLTVIPFSSLGIVKKGKNWVFDGKRRSFDTLLHELTHHSTSHWHGMPPWYQEGLADYMECMPYQSGRFLFTNPGSAVTSSIRKYKKYIVGQGVIPNGVFQMVHPEKLFATDRRAWNGAMVDRIASARNYTSSMVLAYYFMHEDGGKNGAHFIAWLHAWQSAVLSEKSAGKSAKYNNLIKKHLLRDRSYDELEQDIQNALRKKGLRIIFAN